MKMQYLIIMGLLLILFCTCWFWWRSPAKGPYIVEDNIIFLDKDSKVEITGIEFEGHARSENEFVNCFFIEDNQVNDVTLLIR